MTRKTSPAYRASKEETIPINKLHPFFNHPFHIRHDLEFSELVDSISESGIITPIIVRPKVGVGYEVISGHRRWEACKELGIESIPARVEYIDDDEATILMVNSNIQREHVLPSEKAFAYKMRMEALKHQGRATLGQVVPKLKYNRSEAVIGEEVGESYKQVQRYGRCTLARLSIFSSCRVLILFNMVKALLSRMNTSPEVFIALTMSDLSAPLTLVGSINGRIKDLFIAKFGGVVLNSADTIVISAFLGLTLLAVYQNYYFVMSSICGIMEILLTSITAGLGNSYITESKEKNYTDLKKITFMFFWLTGMCTSCFLGIFQPFMRLWVGEKFLMGFSVVVCLCVYFYLYETTRLLNVFKNAGGIWHEDRFRPLISAIVNLALNLISVNYIGIYGIVLSTIVALGVIEIPWLLQNIFTVMYDTSLFKDYFKMFVSWIIATVFSCVIIAVLTYKVTFSGWGAFAFFVVVSVLIPNIVFLLLMHKTEEFKLSISMVNRITHNKLPIIKNL